MIKLENALIKEYCESKKNCPKFNKNLSIYLSKFLLSIIFLMLSIISIRSNQKCRNFFTNEVLTRQFSFAKINDIYNKYFGDVLPKINLDTTPVFNETLAYQTEESYLNGKKMQVGTNYIVPVITSGVIVFLGEKDDLGPTCIVQGVDGVDIWYSNIDISTLNLYDYVEEHKSLAPTLSEFLYLTIDKDGTYLDYETYKA